PDGNAGPRRRPRAAGPPGADARRRRGVHGPRAGREREPGRPHRSARARRRAEPDQVLGPPRAAGGLPARPPGPGGGAPGVPPALARQRPGADRPGGLRRGAGGRRPREGARVKPALAAGVLRVDLGRELRCLSSAVFGGGLGRVRTWVNLQVPSGYARTDPDAHLAEETAGLPGPVLGMLTAAPV